ncbi:phosphoenolpyruvate--protein phosphotransferase [Actinomycetes bacterium KLBMP 9797]
MSAGIGVSPGVAVGIAARLGGDPSYTESDNKVPFHAALSAAAQELERLAASVAAPAADVLGAQALMARDPVLADRIAGHQRAGHPADRAVRAGFAEFRELLAAAGPYLAERVADLDDVRDRVLAHLHGTTLPRIPRPGYPFVLVAEDLSPAQTATLRPGQVLAIVTERGGPTSHTAILAKALGIPAVVACPAAATIGDGQSVLVDGLAGTVDVEPPAGTIAAALEREDRRRAAATAVTGPGRTADGHPVKLLVNVGGDRDLDTTAEGVGLFRTEFLFLDRDEAPTVDEQRAAYGRVFAAFAGRTVVVRTLDAGADKPLRFATAPREPNPALGVRGLRAARRAPELLDGQLRAIAAAAADHDAQVWVMAPMVSTAAEAADFAARAHAHGLPTAGVMVEVPAAALRAEQVAAACDFLSVGTNDLAQYTMAADRQHADLAALLDPWQPAVLELVRRTAEAGARLGKPVGVCGEAASDPRLAVVLVGLGVTSLSMAPVALPAVRAALAAHTLADCRRLAAEALS